MSKRNYIFWKAIFITSTVLLSGFGIYEILLFIDALNRDYPYPALGIDMFNPFQAWQFDNVFVLTFAGVPLIFVIALFIISKMKIKKFKNNTLKKTGENNDAV